MINLTNLVKEYKQTKNKLIIDKIYLELKITIKQKAKFIYYHKWYPLNLYHPCKFCRNCKQLNNVPKSEHNLICKECNKCKCIKGFFNLKKNNLCEYEDIENDIWLEILRTIENFDITKDFNVYLFSNLWEFIPTFITKNFVKSLLNKSLIQTDEEGNETMIESEIESEPKISIEEIFKVCKTEMERKICKLYLENPNLSQEELAEKLGTYKMNISRIINRLQKRLKKIVTK